VILLQKSYCLHQRRFHGQVNQNHPLHAMLCVKWNILGDNVHWLLPKSLHWESMREVSSGRIDAFFH
jgi:hypothetical protein